MGILGWLFGRKKAESEWDVEEPPAARVRRGPPPPPAPTPPPRTPPARAPVPVASAVRSFGSEVAEGLQRRLNHIAGEVMHPADRLLVSALLSAVKHRGLELPALPDEVLRIQRMLSAPDCSIPKLAIAIQHDPAIAARFIAVANSSLYAGAERVHGVEAAIMRIGLRQAGTIVLAIVSQAKLFRVHGYKEEAAELYRHSLATAVAAQIVARRLQLPEQDAFIVGLIHDLGRILVLSLAAAVERDSRGEKKPQKATVDFLSTELHAELSALVAEAWSYGPELVSALRAHHLYSERAEPVVEADVLSIESAEPSAATRAAESSPLARALALADLSAHLLAEDASAPEPARLTALYQDLGLPPPEAVLEETRAALGGFEVPAAKAGGKRPAEGKPRPPGYSAR